MSTSDDVVLIIGIVFACIFVILLLVLGFGIFLRKKQQISNPIFHRYKNPLSSIPEVSQEESRSL